MNKHDHSKKDDHLSEVVIPKENAVFWMDGRGRWCNRHGRFTHKRIIDHFNRAIRRDKNGYYVTQTRGEIREKVYFNYVDTPLFVFQILVRDPIQLVLNNGEIITLDASRLYVKSDQLFQHHGVGCIKFSDRALLAMTPYLEECVDGFKICIGDHSWPIPDHSLSP